MISTITRAFALVPLSALMQALGAQVVQLTPPAFPPPGVAEFGLHCLPASSPNADLVAFSSYSSALVVNDSNSLSDIFLWSRTNVHVRLLSIGTNGTANGSSYDPVLSKDGQFVAFVSSASNFLADTNKIEDVFVANVATGEIELVSPSVRTTGARLGTTRSPVLSEDGRYVAYTTGRNDVLTNSTLTSGVRERVVLRDRVTGETVWVNQALDSIATVAWPVALREGNLWFFCATNLYQFRLADRQLTKVGPSSVTPAFTSDGSRVVIHAASSRTNQIQVFDAQTVTLVAAYGDPTNRVTNYDTVSISDNGLVAFLAASDDTNRNADVYVVDVNDTASRIWVSSIPTPQDTIVQASNPLISPDGTRVYFKIATISKVDSTRHVDLYMRELAKPAPELIQSGMYFAKIIRTPAGPLVLAGSGDFSFAANSDETDLALLPYPAAVVQESVSIAQSGSGWKISFAKIPTATPKVQYTDALVPGAWTDLQVAPEDNGAEWLVTDPAQTNQRFYRLQVSP